VARLFQRTLGSEGQQYTFALIDGGNQELLFSPVDLSPAELDAVVTGNVDRIVPLTELAGIKDSLLGLVSKPGDDYSRRLSSLPVEDLIAYQWRILASEAADRETPGPEDRTGSVPRDVPRGINLHVWHQAGSITRAATLSRNRRLALAYAVLASFALVAVTLFLLYRRARNLRDREHEFVATVTHELRTPVAGVTVVAENLADGLVTDPDRVREYGKVIRDHGRRLRDLIEQVLMYAGLSASAPGNQREFVDLQSSAQSITDLLPHEHRARLMVHLQPDMSPCYGDPIAVELIIGNLVTNSARHAGETASITLSISRTPHEARPQLVIRVSDTGRGVSRRELGKLTEPFYRGEVSRKNQTPGSGLGLSLVNRVVRVCGGTLTIESPPGKGLEVTVRLPCGKGDAGER